MAKLSDYGITNAYTKEEVDALIPKIPENVSAFINDVGYLTEHQDISGKQDKLTDMQLLATWSGITEGKVQLYDTFYEKLLTKQDVLTTAQLNTANSGINSSLVAKYNNYENIINEKAEKATTLDGYGITDTYTKDDIEDMFETLLEQIQDANQD